MSYLTELYAFLRLQAIARRALDEIHGAGQINLMEDQP